MRITYAKRNDRLNGGRWENKKIIFGKKFEKNINLKFCQHIVIDRVYTRVPLIVFVYTGRWGASLFRLILNKACVYFLCIILAYYLVVSE